MAYDSRRAVTVLFGGLSFGAPISDTWEWNGEEWTLRTSEAPWWCADHAMWFDTRRGLTGLFGGWTDCRTWEWDGARWTLVDTDGPAMWDAQVAYDEQRGVAILDGHGHDEAPQTWEWAGQSWTRVDTNWPAVEHTRAMVFDARRSVMVLTGTVSGAYQTWEWDGTSWNLCDDGTATTPSYFSKLVYDARRSVTVAYGGSFPSLPAMWEWDGFLWTTRDDATLPGRQYHALAYDTRRGVTVLFGGYERRPPGVEDTWEWDGAIWTDSHGRPPPVGVNSAAAYDRSNGWTVLFNGEEGAVETWQWTDRWTLLARDGIARLWKPKMTFDEARGVTVLFGEGGDFIDGKWESSSEIWEGSGKTWIKRVGGLRPSYDEFALAFDSNQAVSILFGGRRESRVTSELWTWNGSELHFIGIHGPPPRASHAIAYDRARSQLVLFGGVGGDGSFLGDTWEWDGQTWSLRSVTGPSPRRGHALAYDESRKVTVLFGGLDGSGPSLSDTWEWDGSSWSQRIVARPTEHFGHMLVYDPALEGVLLVASRGWYHSSAVIWQLGRNELWPDVDEDCDVDLSDFAEFQMCFGPRRRGQDCGGFNQDSGRDIGLFDFEGFHRKLSGPAPPQ
jgi:hypothetical protein